jgi:transposase
MAKELVTDELWEVIEPLLPEEPPKPQGGRPRIDNRAALTGILFVLKSGIPWEMLPKEMGCGSGMTCWRRLREWHEAGVWEELHRTLLDRLGKADQIDWERASLDSASVPAPGGAERPARIRRIRANRARSATLCSTEKAFPSRWPTRQPTSMIRSSWKKKPWMPSHRSASLVVVDRGSAPTSSILTRLTTSLDVARP